MKYSIFSFILLISVVACSREPSDRQLLSQSKYWNYAYSGVFQDGGSIAYGFINEEGLPLYIWAESPLSSPEIRRLYLKKSYNDPKSEEILVGSDIESGVKKLVADCDTPSKLQTVLPELKFLKAMLDDRTTPFPYTKEPEIEQSGSPKPLPPSAPEDW